MIVPVALTFGALMIFVLLGGTVAYLTDMERGINIITIGNVQLELSEPSYTENSKVLSAGDSVVKNPILQNTGTKDEYVFIEVAVPKRNVTLLYEQDTTIGEGNEAVTHKEGTPVATTQSEEIYKIIADGVENGATVQNLVDNDELGTNPPVPNAKPQLDFSYNKGNNAGNEKKEGWIYLTRELDKTVNDLTYDYYYFGYNKKLLRDTNKGKKDNNDQPLPPSVGSVTVPLFDRVQLKSFIDEEIPNTKSNEETKILIKGYGIQADSLGGALNNLSDFLDKATLDKIFNIVKEKKR